MAIVYIYNLFLLYVNEIPRLVQSRVKMLADDMKMYQAVCDKRDIQTLQQDIDPLSEWSDLWLLKLNILKCKVMHCGMSNPRGKNTMKQNKVTWVLEETHQEKDLGVLIENSPKPTLHCQKAANRGMSALNLLKMIFNMISKRNFQPLFNAYVWPHIEYCSQAVGPYMKQSFTALGKVQRRATKLV